MSSHRHPLSDPPPFEHIDGTDGAKLLIICDHASAVIPGRYGDLGLAGDSRLSHVAWDIGAATVARSLAARLGCPAILAGVSRLVIDCNRQPGSPDSIPNRSCGVVAPGNHQIDDREADARAETWFWPYHHAIGKAISHLWRHSVAPAVISIHSFTPVMFGHHRPWHVGILYNRDDRMARPLLGLLGRRSGLVVGDNQPYSGVELNYSLETHAGAAGLPHVSFEIRQDLIGDEAGTEHWAALLAEVLKPVLADPLLHRVKVY